MGGPSRYVDDMDDLRATCEALRRQVAEAIAADAIGALPVIAALQKDVDEQLREAVRHAAVTSSWREIAAAIGVSKQAAHQRFNAYAKGVAGEMKAEHRTMKQARRRGDVDEDAQARARRDELAAQLRTAERGLKDQR
jgi:hypothetical protein